MGVVSAWRGLLQGAEGVDRVSFTFLYPPNQGLFGIREEMEKLQQGVVNQLDVASKQQVSHLEEADTLESCCKTVDALQKCVYGMQNIVKKTLLRE